MADDVEEPLGVDEPLGVEEPFGVDEPLLGVEDPLEGLPLGVVMGLLLWVPPGLLLGVLGRLAARASVAIVYAVMASCDRERRTVVPIKRK